MMVNCIFCEIVNRTSVAEIVYEDSLSLAFLDKNPHTRGHLQLIPKHHYRWIYEVPEMGQLFTTAGKIIRGIIPVLKADHVSIATFGHAVKHAHIWIVPQYSRNEIIDEWGSQRGNTNEQQKIANLIRLAIREEVSHAT